MECVFEGITYGVMEHDLQYCLNLVMYMKFEATRWTWHTPAVSLTSFYASSPIALRHIVGMQSCD